MAFELPEAITVARQMETIVTGRRIRAVTLGEKSASLVQQGFIDLPVDGLAGCRFGAVAARGKWIVASLEPGLSLLVALEGGGRVLYHEPGWLPSERAGVWIELDDRGTLEIQVIGWGFVRLTTLASWKQVDHPDQLGISPLDVTRFTLPVLRSLLAAHAGKNLKAFFIDQRHVAGIGSAYLQDLLYRACLHPLRLAGSLTVNEQERLFAIIRDTLQTALSLGGRESECDLFGVPGRYNPAMSGQLRGRPCPECGTLIEKLAVQGSTIYLCPHCQGPDQGEFLLGLSKAYACIC